MNGGYIKQIQYLNYFIRYKTMKLLNAINFPSEIEFFDIDCIKQKDDRGDVTHIQLKYSVNKQDASFLTEVLENFLGAYLLDQSRSFKLVYDFPVANCHLSKMFAFNLDEKSRTHWMNVISNIKQNNPSWNWSVYDFDKFISHFTFEKIENLYLKRISQDLLLKIIYRQGAGFLQKKIFHICRMLFRNISKAAVISGLLK